jgi:hypothetical protein
MQFTFFLTLDHHLHSWQQAGDPRHRRPSCTSDVLPIRGRVRGRAMPRAQAHPSSSPVIFGPASVPSKPSVEEWRMGTDCNGLSWGCKKHEERKLQHSSPDALAALPSLLSSWCNGGWRHHDCSPSSIMMMITTTTMVSFCSRLQD